MLYLDPHEAQPAVALDTTDFQSYHTRLLKWMSVDKLDPSLLIAVLVRDKQEMARIQEYLGKQPSAVSVQPTRQRFDLDAVDDFAVD